GFVALTAVGVIAAASLLGPGGAIAVAVATLVGVFASIAAFNWKTISESVPLLSTFTGALGAILAFDWQMLTIAAKGIVTAVGIL
ncbi:hypothetical protein AB2C63_32415, partial [Pseudomonas aeruginosa]